MKNIILIAPPAAGKGTLSKLLSEKFGYISLSTGDMLREKAKKDLKLKEKMQNGQLIKDDIVFEILEEVLNKLDNNLYILDGFPRTIEQAKMYGKLLEKLKKEIGIVIYLNVDKEELKKRTISRLICPACKRSYSTLNEELKPCLEGICDTCKTMLIKREDDNFSVFEKRYEEYIEKTTPLINYYKDLGVLHKIDSVKAQDTLERVIKLIN